MRKLTATIAFAVLLLFSAAAVQAQDVTFTLENDPAPENGQVVVPVRVNGFADVTSVQFSINWDADLIAFASVDSSAFEDAVFGRPGQGNLGSGDLTYSVSFPLEDASLEDESKLFELTFDIIDGNAETADLQFSNTPTPIELFVNDEDATDSFIGVNGTAVLPVELTGFQAVAEGRDALLSWETLSETGNQGFEVQQQIDGRFQKVGYEKSHNGTTTERQAYSHRVRNLASGQHVFRLKQVDADGDAHYSKTVEATVALTAAYEMSGVYPNPFRAEAKFDLQLQTAQHVRVEVFDVLGRRVAQLHDGILAADVRHHFELGRQNLSSGMYIIRVLGESFQRTQTATLVR